MQPETSNVARSWPVALLQSINLIPLTLTNVGTSCSSATNSTYSSSTAAFHSWTAFDWFALLITLANVPIKAPAKIAITAITITNSTNVNP